MVFVIFAIFVIFVIFVNFVPQPSAVSDVVPLVMRS